MFIDDDDEYPREENIEIVKKKMIWENHRITVREVKNQSTHDMQFFGMFWPPCSPDLTQN